MKFSSKVRTGHLVGVTMLFKQLPLKRLTRRRVFFLRVPHRHKPRRRLPAYRPIDTAIVLNRIGYSGLVPPSGIKSGLSFLAGSDEVKRRFSGSEDTFPGKKLCVRSQGNLLNTTHQPKVLFSLVNKTQHRTVSLLPSISGIVSHPTSLLIPVHRFPNGINTDMDQSVPARAQMPGPLPQHPAYSQNRPRLIDPHSIHMAPGSTGCWQTNKPKEPTYHSIQSDIDKMPQTIEGDKEQHQNGHNHSEVLQVGFSVSLLARPTRMLIGRQMVFFLVDQALVQDRCSNLLNRAFFVRR